MSTWREAIANAEERLREAGIEESDINAEFLALHVLGLWKRGELASHLGDALSQDAANRYEQLLERRLKREPVQYIIGETEFYGVRLKTDPRALIPRPETEMLVEEAIARLHMQFGAKDLTMLDIGTGSGAIALAVANNFPNVRAIGIDISAPAIELAMENAMRLKLRNVNFAQMDIWKDDVLLMGQFDVVASNPPYISERDFAELAPELINFEPPVALTDHSDGLTFYRRIAQLAPRLLKPEGTLLLEISYAAAEHVSQILIESQLNVIEVRKDWAGIGRLMIASR